MSLLHQVNPEGFINTATSTPANGRGAWTKSGIDFEYRYMMSADPAMRIGTRAEVSLAHWAVAAGSFAIQRRLVELGHLAPLGTNERGIFGQRTKDAVQAFQDVNFDPDGGAELVVDGIVGRSDARALFTPLILTAEAKYAIPNRLVLGQTAAESALDPGAVGYYIFYPDYRGVDRAFGQINSKAHPEISWLDAFDPKFALNYSAKRLRDTFNLYRTDFPKQLPDVLWDAAVCAHNSPVNGRKWASTGIAPTEQAAAYVAAVKNARY